MATREQGHGPRLDEKNRSQLHESDHISLDVRYHRGRMKRWVAGRRRFYIMRALLSDDCQVRVATASDPGGS